jgi:hypothetical protein
VGQEVSTGGNRAAGAKPKFELYFVYVDGSTNHTGPIFGQEEAEEQAAKHMKSERHLETVYVIPYTAGSFHPDLAVAKIDRWDSCPTCGHRYDPHTR